MRRTRLAALLLPALATALATAQQPTGATESARPEPGKVAPGAMTALPAAGSPEAAALFDKACAKMQAVGRGAFTSTEE